MVTRKRADVLSLAELGNAVDRAVTLASKRHALKTEGGTLLVNWEIIGRLLRDFDDLNGAFKFAKDVAGAVKIRGVKAEPTVLKIGPDILCGFIERGQLNRQIGR